MQAVKSINSFINSIFQKKIFIENYTKKRITYIWRR